MQSSFKHLRNLLFIFLLLACSSSIGHAQTLEFVPRIGLTLSQCSLNSDDTAPSSTDKELKPGLMIGTFIKVLTSEKVNLYSGISYIEKGSKTSHLAYSGNLKNINAFDIKLKYLDLPLQANVLIKKSSNNSALYLILGAGFSYWIGGNFNVYFSYDDPNGGPPFQASANGKVKYNGESSGVSGYTFYIAKRYDLNIYPGMGFSIGNKINLEISYAFGFTDIEYFPNTFGKNRVLQILAGIPLKVKKTRI